MRRFRRKRRGGIWLPVYGNSVNGASTDFVAGGQSIVPVADSGAVIVEAVPVTFDYTESAWQTQSGALTNTLHDIVSGQEWRLRRIVGKLHAVHATRIPETNGTTAAATEFAAGYMVLKTDEEGDPLTDLNEVNPLIQESADDPWIWRRKWILGNSSINVFGYFNEPTDPVGKMVYQMGKYAWPYATANYNSVADGPHIDQKTNRVIHRQERLFLIMATRIYNPTGQTIGPYSEESDVYVTYDHRFFGSLSFNRGNRRNASR